MPVMSCTGHSLLQIYVYIGPFADIHNFLIASRKQQNNLKMATEISNIMIKKANGGEEHGHVKSTFSRNSHLAACKNKLKKFHSFIPSDDKVLKITPNKNEVIIKERK